ncbi:PASTA domain-containing protein [Streptomyces phaeochromogenes]|uniref:PASTA domain-containing protein n=1 Tax=Streptomyces phaeochromogenes TaxID=1923 RepID=UPI003698079C
MRPGRRRYRPRLHHRQCGLIQVRSRRRHLLGAGLDDAKGQLAKTQIKLGTVDKVDCGKYGKPGTVIQVDPHSPKTVASGDTVNVTLCAG